MLENTNPFAISTNTVASHLVPFNQKQVIDEIMELLPSLFPHWHVIHSPDVEGDFILIRSMNVNEEMVANSSAFMPQTQTTLRRYQLVVLVYVDDTNEEGQLRGPEDQRFSDIVFTKTAKSLFLILKKIDEKVV